MHMNNETHRWMERPLPANMLSYAARDVRSIAHLLKIFRSRRLVPSKNGPALDKLKSQSERYVTRNGAHARAIPGAPNEFTVFTGDRTLFFPNALSGPLVDLFECITCSSRLPLECYQLHEGRRRVECRACVAWMGAPQLGKDVIRMTVAAPPEHRVESDYVQV